MDDDLRSVFEDVLAERRSRRDPEHALIAATVAYTAGVIWGVATLSAVTEAPCTALGGGAITAVGSIVIVAAIVKKIWATHEVYALNQKALSRISNSLDAMSPSARRLAPEYMTASAPGGGVKWSLYVVAAAGALAVVFNAFIAGSPFGKLAATGAAIVSLVFGAECVYLACPKAFVAMFGDHFTSD